MLNSPLVSIFVGSVLGFLSGLGIGGGSLLILWLTIVLHTDPETARSINLLFFLPSAAIAVAFRRKQGYVNASQVLPAILAGTLSAAVCSFLAAGMDMELLKKLFGGLLLLTGLRELLYRPRQK